MVNCGACGRFVNKKEGVTCTTCSWAYHPCCLGEAKLTAKLPGWSCPECSKNKPRDNHPDTPVKNSSGTPSSMAEVNNASGMASPVAMNIPDMSRADVCERVVVALELRLSGQLSSIQEELKLLRMDVQDLRSSQETYMSRLDSLEGRVGALEEQLKKKCDTVGKQESIVQELRMELNERDQQLLGNDIEISNVPECPGENAVHLVALIARKLGTAVEERDVVSAERVGPVRSRGDGNEHRSANRPRPLVVRLSRRSIRDDLLHNMRVRRGADTADFGLAAESRPFYVNERLTKYNRQLLSKTREVRKQANWRFVWTRRGRILVKQEEGKPTYSIRTFNDLHRVFGVGSVTVEM